MGIPIGLHQLVNRLNSAKFLPAKRQLLHQDAAGGFYLVDLNKAKSLTPAQVELLALELDALQDETINFG